MAWHKIEHVCGHTVERDIGGWRGRNRESREGLIGWLQSLPCMDCVHAEESARDKALSKAEGLPPLTGSEKQIAWAETLRRKILGDSFLKRDTLNELGVRIRDAMERKTEARWWIDNRHEALLTVMEAVAIEIGAYKPGEHDQKEK